MKIQCFILSTTSSVRSNTLLETLTMLSIPFIIVENNDVLLAKTQWQLMGQKEKADRSLNDFQRSCSFGHRLMYFEALQKQEQFDIFLFLEDDVVIDLKRMRDLLRDRWFFLPDLLLLGSCGGWAAKKSIFINPTIISRKVFNDCALGSHAYLATPDAIKALIQGTQALDRLQDSFARSPHIEMLVASPSIAFQEGTSASLIPMTSFVGSQNVLRKYLSSLWHDLLDVFYYSRFGNRFIRLPAFDRFLKIIFYKLPGCNLQDLDSQIG